MKQYVKLLKGKRLKSVASAGIQPFGVLSGRRASITFDRRKRAEGMWHLRVCYSPSPYAVVGSEDRLLQDAGVMALNDPS